MRIGIAGQQHHLKKEHASGPDAWSTAKPGQDIFADQRLHLEQQKRSDKDCQRVRRHGADCVSVVRKMEDGRSRPLSNRAKGKTLSSTWKLFTKFYAIRLLPTD